MYQILSKKVLNPTVTQMEIEAPLVARKAKPGQFIILRVDEDGERIPLTVAGTDPERGAVKIIFQIVGKTTFVLGQKEAGESIADFVGPLGRPTEMEGLKKVCIVGGGVGCAIALPVAEEMHRLGIEVTSIIGFRSVDLLILEDEFRAASDKLIVMTDDGSYARQGNVTVPLKEMLEARGAEKVSLSDLTRDDLAEGIEDAFRYDRLVLMSSSYDGGVFPVMEDFLCHLRAKNYQSRRIAIVENGSWAPSAGRVIKGYVEQLKNITLVEPMVTIKSSLSAESEAKLAELADALVK